MVDILHAVGVKAQAADVYKALTTCEGLAGWWTDDTKGESGAVDGIVTFRFGTRGFFDMRVTELDPGKRVSWQVADGPQDWIGTKVHFDIRKDDGGSTILFKHEGWRQPIEFMHHCSTKWATFLMSLKSMIETGKGKAYPNDVHISVNGD